MKNVQELLDIMAKLRNPEGGCPWDLEQNFASIVPHTLEEAYEVAEAIEQNDKESLRSELGDLLFQIVFYTQMATEENSFTFSDVVDTIIEKITSRHPHIFGAGDVAVNTSSEQVAVWENQKEKERLAKALLMERKVSVLDDVPHALPALLRASKLQKRAARVGFNWKNVEDIFLKLEEEIAEFKHETEPAPREEELGDMLFVMVNIANYYNINPEEALRKANSKFERRFKYIEEALHKENRNPTQSNLEEMDKFWNEAKALEKQVG